MGFLLNADIAELVKLDRLCPVLVRCGGCRFTCGAQDAKHIMAAIELAGDYVRDVSFPAGSLERAAKWQPARPAAPITMLPARFLAPRKAQRPTPDYGYTGQFDDDWRGDADSGL